MVKSFMSLIIIPSLLLLSLTFSAIAQQYKDTVLTSSLYSGKQVNQSVEHLFEGITIAGSSEKGVSPKYNRTRLPLLIGFPQNEIERFIRSSGLYKDYPVETEETLLNDTPRLEFSNADFIGFSAVKVTDTDLSTVEATDTDIPLSALSLIPDAVGYYVHDGSETLFNILFHSTEIYNPQKTPYYQEIKEKFKGSREIIFKEKKTRFENKNLKFYHKKRDDGYIESYGFFLPQKQAKQEAKAVLLFQGLYPESDKAKIAKHVKQLFKSHLKAFKTRYKE